MRVIPTNEQGQPIGIAARPAVVSGSVSTPHGKTIKSKTGSVSSSGNNTILSAVSGKKLTVFACKVTSVTTTKVTALWQDGAGGTDLWGHEIQTPANVHGGDAMAVAPPAHLFQGSTNTLLNLNLSGAIAVRYAISYWEE